MFRSWFRRSAIAGLGLVLLTTAACGPEAATPTQVAPTATVAALPADTAVPATATSEPATATVAPATATSSPAPPTVTEVPPTATVVPPTATEPSASPTAARDLAARPTATAEPEDCFRSVGVVISRVDQAYNHQPGDTATIAKDLQSACVDDRALGIWALGSIHDKAALPALQAYVAAHPDGDWRRDEYDLVPVAQAAIAYIQAPLDTTHTYMVRPRGLYAAQPRYDADGHLNLSPAQTIPAAAPLVRVQTIHTGDMRPDHGGETEVVFARVQRPNDPKIYYLEVSRYVSSEPSFFEPVDLEPVQ